MKKVILSLLAIILVVGLLAVTGFTGYRLGYAQGMRVTVNGDTSRPAVRPFNNSNPRNMPMMRDFAFWPGFPSRLWRLSLHGLWAFLSV